MKLTRKTIIDLLEFLQDIRKQISTNNINVSYENNEIILSNEEIAIYLDKHNLEESEELLIKYVDNLPSFDLSNCIYFGNKLLLFVD